MLDRSILNQTLMASPLAGQSVMNPKGSRSVKDLVFTLNLTSLIDAFSILVIFLLISFGPGNPVQSNGIELPMATQTEAIEQGFVVTVRNNKTFIEDKEVTNDQVFQKLYELHQKKADSGLIIEADKRSDYASISPIIMAGAQAGFEKFKFAVVPGGTQK